MIDRVYAMVAIWTVRGRRGRRERAGMSAGRTVLMEPDLGGRWVMQKGCRVSFLIV